MRRVMHGDIYNDYTLNLPTAKDQGFYVEILEKIEALFTQTLSQQGRVFFLMFVLKYPAGSAQAYPNDNTFVSRFIEALTLYYRRRKHNPKYLWVREVSTTGQVHYHFILLLNANYVQNGYGVLAQATDLWQRCLDIDDGRGLVHLCTSGETNDTYGGVKLMRNDPCFKDVFSQCYKRASYLAKCYSKGSSPAHVNEFGSSRLP